MRFSIHKHPRAMTMLAAIGVSGLLAGQAHAQFGHPYSGSRYDCPPYPCPPASQMLPPSAAPAPTPSMPTSPLPAQPTAPESAALPLEQSFAAGGNMVALADSSVGYIDSAIIGSQIRLRYDAAYNNRFPDRAEFFYPKCGCFPVNPGPGPVGPETGVDYQDISTYLEVALSREFSVFIEAPYRLLNPDVNPNTNGIADINAGFKAALYGDQDTALTFQFRTWFPTGDGRDGLGTEHYTLEPALLLFERLSPDLTFEAEFHYYIPIGGTEFAGDVIRYGVGLGYDVCENCCYRVTPIVELVGWTVLDGLVTDLSPNVPGNIRDVSGETIVNVKAGVRTHFGRADIYAGYGHALTSDAWYEDIIRFEFRFLF